MYTPFSFNGISAHKVLHKPFWKHAEDAQDTREATHSGSIQLL